MATIAHPGRLGCIPARGDKSASVAVRLDETTPPARGITAMRGGHFLHSGDGIDHAGISAVACSIFA